jgi:hypothetical protein
VTTDRRLAAIEGSLTPTELICHWLDVAHAFDSLEAYVDWQIDQPVDHHYPDRLLRQAGEAARKQAGRGAAADEQVRQAYRETLFRFELVLRINVVIHETLSREWFIRTILGLRFAMLIDDDDRPSASTQSAEILLLADARSRFLANLDAARVATEAEYLAGHPALFPAEQRRLEEGLREARQHVAMQARMGELDGWLPPGEPETPEQQAAIIAGLVADFVEPAKVHALEKLDETRRAYGIATRWLRPKVTDPQPARQSG